LADPPEEPDAFDEGNPFDNALDEFDGGNTVVVGPYGGATGTLPAFAGCTFPEFLICSLKLAHHEFSCTTACEQTALA
jgi:hypothetical protein